MLSRKVDKRFGVKKLGLRRINPKLSFKSIHKYFNAFNIALSMKIIVSMDLFFKHVR